MPAVKPNETDRAELCDIRCIHLDKVTAARAVALPPDKLARLSRLFKALADPSRLAMLTALMTGELCVCDLAAVSGLSQSAVSHHLRRFKDLGLVTHRRDGQVVYYSLDCDHTAELITISLDHIRD